MVDRRRSWPADTKLATTARKAGTGTYIPPLCHRLSRRPHLTSCTLPVRTTPLTASRRSITSASLPSASSRAAFTLRRGSPPKCPAHIAITGPSLGASSLSRGPDSISGCTTPTLWPPAAASSASSSPSPASMSSVRVVHRSAANRRPNLPPQPRQNPYLQLAPLLLPVIALQRPAHRWTQRRHLAQQPSRRSLPLLCRAPEFRLSLRPSRAPTRLTRHLASLLARR